MLKILVIGDMGAGKTCLVNQFLNNKFDSTYKATISCEFAVKNLEIEGEKIKVQIWDIAGQDRLGGISKLYCRDAVGAVVVYDILDEPSFQNVEEWKRQIDSHVVLPDGSPLPMVLLANKYDRVEEISNSERIKHSKKEFIEDFSVDHCFMGAFQTSAKSGLNVEESFLFLIKEILKHDLKSPFSKSENLFSELGAGDTFGNRSLKLSTTDKTKESSCC